MNEYVETAVKIKDTVSEFIPAKLSVIIKLAELAFDTFGKVDDSLNSLYKKAFKEAVENVAKDVDVHNIRELLRNCGEINSLNDVQNLNEYLKKISAEMGIFLSEKDLLQITGSIVEKFDNILIEDKYDKLYKWFLLCTKPDVLRSDLNQIKETLNKIYEKTYRIETDNKFYAKDFINPLFRHRRNTILTLKDVFVMPNVKFGEKTYNALDVICTFINGNDDVLFIEGFGGYGKSSIVSFLAYNYMFNRASLDISFLENKQLIIIRLRDIQGEDKIKAMIERLDLNNFYDIEDDAILIFDGLDEICMMDKGNGSAITEDIIKAFSYNKRKIIITTRPTCINYSEIDFLDAVYNVVEVCCFNAVQREMFADLFAQKDKNHYEAVRYVKSLPLEKQENENIYGSPFLLYLILSGGINKDEQDNSWLLMHRLFHDELFNPPYSYNRGIDKETAEIIYQFNCDLAYEMFKTQNRKLFITSAELKKILPKEDIKNIVKHSHGLFSYMRRSNDGAVEFVHNHIRDYFLCEKVLREINKWYLNGRNASYQIALNLGRLLIYDEFNNEVKSFIYEAIQYSNYMRNVIDKCVYKTILDKCECEPLSNIFDWFYKSGGIISYNINTAIEYNYKKASYYVINNAAYIYKIIYEFQLEDGEYIHWISDGLLISADLYFYNDLIQRYTDYILFELMRSCLNRAYLSGAHLTGIVLSEADLSDSNLKDTELDGAVLRYSDFNGADLDRTDFSKADLCGADLSSALNVSNAIFYNTKYDNNTQFPNGFTVSISKFKKIDDNLD